MTIFIVVLQSVLALIGIGVLGFWILRRGFIPDHVIVFLSRLAIDIAVPCVILSGIVTNFDTGRMPDWWQLPLERWSEFHRQNGTGLKCCATPIRIASFTPGSVFQ